jgi:hypothetical protein
MSPDPGSVKLAKLISMRPPMSNLTPFNIYKLGRSGRGFNDSREVEMRMVRIRLKIFIDTGRKM